MASFCFDWDDTLVDAHSQQWLDGAERTLRHLYLRGHTLTVMSARARFPVGRQQIEDRLAQLGLELEVYAKPQADLYIDDRAYLFDGDWDALTRRIRRGDYPQPRRRRHLTATQESA